MKIKYLSTLAAASLLSFTLIACGGCAGKKDGCAGCAGKEGGCAGKTEQPAEEKPAE